MLFDTTTAKPKLNTCARIISAAFNDIQEYSRLLSGKKAMLS
jgi:hypothetical protein